MIAVYSIRDKQNKRYAIVVCGIIAAFAAVFAFIGFRYFFSLGVLAFMILVYLFLRRRFWKRNKLLKSSFPVHYIEILKDEIPSYSKLSEENKEVLHSRIMIFLSEVKIVGIGTDVEDIDRILVATSALLPVMSFREFEYSGLKEVLIYPEAFDENYQYGLSRNKKGASILGQVNSGQMSGTMILTKPALRTAFKKHTQKSHVGFHEFIHLVDGADGRIDGVPAMFMTHSDYKLWQVLMKEEIKAIRSGKSDISRYALTNEVEFFAVSCEYFFDTPKKFRKEHPELYKLLVKVFQQEPSD